MDDQDVLSSRDLALKMMNYNTMVFDRIFHTSRPDQDRRTIDAPSSVLKEDRRKPVNIATVCNHDAECLRRIIAAGFCTCSDQEVEATP